MGEQEAKKVVTRRLRMPTRAFDEVDWEIHGAALQRIAPRERIMIRRMIWEELPTARKLARNGYM